MVKMSATSETGRLTTAPPEHVGPVEIHVALRIRQDPENAGCRCFDPA